MMALTKYDWVSIVNKKQPSNKQRILYSLEQGIPEYLRGDIWLFLTRAHQTSSKFGPMTYLYLLKSEDAEVEDRILKDVTRTFPGHSMFKDLNGPG